MKQLVQDPRSPDVRVADVPPPLCRPGGLVVRTQSSFISSGTERAAVRLGARSLAGKAIERPDLVRAVLRRLSDEGVAGTVAAVRARLETPRALGYTASGVVVQVGEGVGEFRAGDRVACAGQAGHAELNWVPANLCVPIPGGVDFEEAAAVALGAIALHGARVGGAAVGERVAIIGLGLIGLLAVQISKAAGCTIWGLDPDPKRVEMARQLGADTACLISEWREQAWAGACRAGQGADVVLLCAATRSAEPVEIAGQLARDRGVVVVVGDVRVDVPRETYYRKELAVRYSRSYGPGRYDANYEQRGADYPYGFVRWTERRNMEAFLAMVAAGKASIKPLITHRVPVTEAPRAYEMLAGGGREKPLGIVLEYPAPAPEQPFHSRVFVSPPRAESNAPAAGIVRVGWIGAGAFSREKLIPNLKKLAGVRLAGLANGHGLSAESAARRFGFAWCSADPSEVIHDPEADAVFIATPHASHGSLVAQALSAGKHVFVEKPLCIGEMELEEIERVWVTSGRMLMVDFNRRFSPFARECRAWFAGRGPLSIGYRVHAGKAPAGHWLNDRANGGRIAGEACHFIDLAQFLCGARIVDVEARRAGLEDAHIALSFADGSRAAILYLASGDAAVPKERIEVFGGGRTAVCDDFRRWSLYGDGRSRTRWRLRREKGHGACIRSFVEALRKGAEAPIPFTELHATTLAALRAAALTS